MNGVERWTSWSVVVEPGPRSSTELARAAPPSQAARPFWCFMNSVLAHLLRNKPADECMREIERWRVRRCARTLLGPRPTARSDSSELTIRLEGTHRVSSSEMCYRASRLRRARKLARGGRQGWGKRDEGKRRRAGSPAGDYPASVPYSLCKPNAL